MSATANADLMSFAGASVEDLMKKNIETIVDELGLVKADIAELEKKEELLKNVLINSPTNPKSVDGTAFKASISRQEYDQYDYKVVVEAMLNGSLGLTPAQKGALTKLLNSSVKTVKKVVVRVSAR